MLVIAGTLQGHAKDPIKMGKILETYCFNVNLPLNDLRKSENDTH